VREEGRHRQQGGSGDRAPEAVVTARDRPPAEARKGRAELRSFCGMHHARVVVKRYVMKVGDAKAIA
jgi:hypothetical protein